MCSGRFVISGSVVYSSRTNPWNALPPSRSSLNPRMPHVRSTSESARELDARGGALGARRARNAV
jgi:hypothetical protein